MELGRLRSGAEQTLDDFRSWRDDNPEVIAARITSYTEVLRQEEARHGGLQAMLRWARPSQRINFQQDNLTRWAGVFELFNAGEIPDPERCRRIGREMSGSVVRVEAELGRVAVRRLTVSDLSGLLAIQFPELAGSQELESTHDRLQRLYRILPEQVVQAGGMGKVTRTIMGVLALAAYDTFDEPYGDRQSRMRRVLPVAYAYGAAYVIVDDSLQDMPGDYISDKEKDRYNRVISEGLATGDPIDAEDLPDHPLAIALRDAYGTITAEYPIGEYPHLYQAAASLYHAQFDESQRTITSATECDTASLYPNTLIKGAMTRVVADILAGRRLDDGFYSRIINTVFLGQMRDDMGDRLEDRQADSVTPFTVSWAKDGDNPLYDLFAYDAYATARIFGGDPLASQALCYANAVKCAERLQTEPRLLPELLRDYDYTDEMRRYLTKAAALPRRVADGLISNDIRVSRSIGRALGRRSPSETDPRTFVIDHREYIDEVIRRYTDVDPTQTAYSVGEVSRYALGGEGKRLRPALTLMLAEGLGVEHERIGPLLAAIEVFHAASLIFDDLPAQDNATLRRGRAVAHKAFPEYAAQIAGVSMIARAFGILGQLRHYFPPDKVAETVEYVGEVLGGKLCEGQYLDLTMERFPYAVPDERIIEMYSLKTSSLLEAALVPLMMLTGQPEQQTDITRRFANHAGIVYQIRDDILDVTSTSQDTGKDSGMDNAKRNLVRAYGLEESRRQLSHHLGQADARCHELPFNTSLLQGMVRYFAERRR